MVRAAVTEANDLERLERKPKTDGLFRSDDSHRFAYQSLKNLEKIIFPILTTITGVLLITAGVSDVILNFLNQGMRDVSRNPLSVAGFASFVMISTMLIGSYFNGLSREKGCRWLRPIGALYLLIAFLFSVAIAIMLLEHIGYAEWDIQIGKMVIFIYVLFGLELLVNVLLEFYRPKRIDRESMPLHESRFLSFFTQPGGIVGNVVRTLDYQFGFKVTDAWLSTFFTRTFVPGLILACTLLYMLDCIVTIDSHEMGVIETYKIRKGFGRKIVGPGIHFKLPRPLMFCRKYPVNEIRTMTIGYSRLHESDEKFPSKMQEDFEHIQAKVITWDHQHFNSEQYFLTASNDRDTSDASKDRPPTPHQPAKTVPVSLLSVNMPVQYKIDEKALVDYFYNYENPEEILRGICHRELIRFFASADLFGVLGSGLLASQKELTYRIKATLKAVSPATGLEVRHISLTNIHPPIDIASAFQKVVAAEEENIGKIHQAQGYASKIANEAAAQEASIALETEAYRIERTGRARAQASRFTGQQLAFQQAPDIFRARSLMAILQSNQNIRRFFMHGDSKKIIQVNLEEPLRPDLLNDLEFEDETE